MKKDAEEHAGEDKSRRELIDLKNRSEMVIYSTRKSLEEHGGKVSADVRGSIESAISNLEGKVKADDKAAIEAALRQLENASMELGKAVYEATSANVAGGAGPQEAGAAAGGKKDDDIIDAEYEVKDDEKS
jgi:molecular chaperone DnaK